ncbi:hypothetical protein TA5114_01859 [Cognatishimia activa]|uniref:Uncharacterized protein n=1 Tax=Cognatishimia activa TaxID=1715691 RepID=A0A0P1IRH5_9RHOB|nr:hypothetical protein TA5113_02167 [Cognatishimia activa]CUK26052.1 hypothetical protein TA5114_01859 [Cognatishimia activa]
MSGPRAEAIYSPKFFRLLMVSPGGKDGSGCLVIRVTETSISVHASLELFYMNDKGLA